MDTSPTTFKDFYNWVMSGLEPDLMTQTLPYLDTMYEGETEQQASERLERYQAALNECQDIIESMQVEHERLVEARELEEWIAGQLQQQKATQSLT